MEIIFNILPYNQYFNFNTKELTAALILALHQIYDHMSNIFLVHLLIIKCHYIRCLKL